MSSHWPPVRMSPERELEDFQKWLVWKAWRHGVRDWLIEAGPPWPLCRAHSQSPARPGVGAENATVVWTRWGGTVAR